MNSKFLLVLLIAFIMESRSMTLDDAGLYNVDWIVDSVANTITFYSTVQTKGFVGLGLSPVASMWEADITIGGVHNNGTSYFNDYYGVGQTRPQLDESQDYTLIEASENATHTHLVFSRPLITGDKNDVQITENGTNFIWSFGQTDQILYHGPNRGNVSINLLEGASTLKH